MALIILVKKLLNVEAEKYSKLPRFTVPENKRVSIKTALDRRVETRLTSKQRLCASPTATWLAFVAKYLKYQSCSNLPLAPTYPGVPLGLFKKYQLWKLKVGRVVSHGFRHAEFDGARKKIDFKLF